MLNFNVLFEHKNSYRDFREPYNSPDKFEYTKIYYYVLVARLTFLVLFEVIARFLNSSYFDKFI
jgi:hypothetical protein